MRFSVAIITKNEEERLPGCLESVSFAEDIVVVDSGSSDRTVEIATEFGANVFLEAWRGFSWQKQFAVDKCQHDWVLILDADERVTAETAEKLSNIVMSQGDNAVAYSLRRKNFLHGKWIRHCGWWPDKVVRFVDRRKGRFDGRAVHERWVSDGKLIELSNYIEHHSFRNYSELIGKMERYSNISAQGFFENDRRCNFLTPVGRGAWMFFKTYLLELGILNGFDGFVISLTNAGGTFFKFAKLHELINTGVNAHFTKDSK